MKPTTIGLLKTALIAASLAGASVALGQASIGGPGSILNVSAPPGLMFPPTIPTVESDDSYVEYHYTFGGTGYWSYLTENGGGTSDSILEGVKEDITHYKTSDSSVSTTHLTGFYGNVYLSFCLPFCGITSEPVVTHYPPQPGDTTTFPPVLCGTLSGGPAPFDDVYIGSDTQPYATTPDDSDCASDDDFGNDIIKPFTATTFCCGTITTASSGSSCTIPVGGWSGFMGDGCTGGPAYGEYYFWTGSYLDIHLWITNGGCAPPPLSPAPPPTISNISGSGNPMTPSGGGFDAAGDFSFSFTVPTPDTYTVYASTDLQNWRYLGQVSATSQGTFIDTGASSTPQRFYLVVEGVNTGLCLPNPSDAYGFVSINVTTSGAMIANPLLPDNGAMSIGTLLPNMPNGTTVELWDQVNGTWGSPATFSSGSWDNPQLNLIPGSGALITPTANTTIKFIGQVIQGTQNYIQSGYNVRSSVLPLSGYVTDLGLINIADGTTILKWAGNGYTTYTYSASSGTWSPSTPFLNLGEAILINSPTDTAWNQTFNTPAEVGCPCDPAPSEIAAWWRAENNTVDSIGGNNGTAINNLGFESGEVGTAFSLNGNNSYLLVQSSNPSLNVGAGNGMTIEGWINPAVVNREQLLSEWERILGSRSGADVGVNFAIEPTGELFVNFKAATGIDHTLASPSGALTANAWQHVAMTYDKDSGIGALYINGVAVASQNFGRFTPLTSYTNLVIGARTYNATESAPISVFGGGMDEWALYQRALSPNEISAIYAAGSSGKCFPPPCDPAPAGIASWWRAENDTVDSIGANSPGNNGGNNGTAINNLGFEPGEVGTAFSLDGNSSYVLVQSSNPSLNVGAGTGMTIEGWINPTSVNREQLLTEWEAILGSDSGYDVGALFYIEPSGTLNANLEDTSSTPHTLNSAANVLTANTWQHVAVTYDKGSGMAVLYVNGAVVASQNFGSFTPQTSYPNMLIGARTYLASESAPRSVFGGGIDEWAIYQRALSPTEISAIFDAGASGKCPPQ